MSSKKDIKSSTICKYCGTYIDSRYMRFKQQQVHAACAYERGPDFIVNDGNFHMELYTDLISDKELKRIMKTISGKPRRR